jgi:hypothetical protein
VGIFDGAALKSLRFKVQRSKFKVLVTNPDMLPFPAVRMAAALSREKRSDSGPLFWVWLETETVDGRSRPNNREYNPSVCFGGEATA